MQFGWHGFCQICQTVLNGEFGNFHFQFPGIWVNYNLLSSPKISSACLPASSNRSLNGFGHILSSSKSKWLIPSRMAIPKTITFAIIWTFRIWTVKTAGLLHPHFRFFPFQALFTMNRIGHFHSSPWVSVVIFTRLVVSPIIRILLIWFVIVPLFLSFCICHLHHLLPLFGFLVLQ